MGCLVYSVLIDRVLGFRVVGLARELALARHGLARVFGLARVLELARVLGVSAWANERAPQPKLCKTISG